MKIEVKALVVDMLNQKVNAVEIDGDIFRRVASVARGRPKLTQPVKRSYKKKDKDDVVYLKKRNLHIKQQHIDKIKRAICHVENNYISDFKHIQRFTKMPVSTLHVILHWMKSQNMIRMITRSISEEGIGILTGKKKLSRVYELVDNQVD